MAYKRISPQPVAEGGTGASTLTGVLTGNGTSAITANTVTQNTVLVGGSSNSVQDSPVIVSSAGEMTNPSQPSFLAYINTTITNVSGDGTVYTVIYDTERFDQNSDFNLGTSTFTAPLSGKYQLSCLMALVGGTSISQSISNLVTSNLSYQLFMANPGQDITRATGSISLIVDMDSSDTATVTIASTDSGGKVDDAGGLLNGGARNVFSGILIC